MAQIQQNDAAGGAGSISQQLLGIAVNGISRYVDGRLSAKYPLTSFNERETLNAAGQVKPASAPQQNVAATDKVASVLQNPYVIGGVIAAAVAVIVAFAVRK